MSALSDVKKFLDDLHARIDAMCDKACERFDIDKEEFRKEFEGKFKKDKNDGTEPKKDDEDSASKDDKESDVDDVETDVEDEIETKDDEDGESNVISEGDDDADKAADKAADADGKGGAQEDEPQTPPKKDAERKKTAVNRDDDDDDVDFDGDETVDVTEIIGGGSNGRLSEMLKFLYGKGGIFYGLDRDGDGTVDDLEDGASTAKPTKAVAGEKDSEESYGRYLRRQHAIQKGLERDHRSSDLTPGSSATGVFGLDNRYDRKRGGRSKWGKAWDMMKSVWRYFTESESPSDTHSLYKRAKFIFESSATVDESEGGYTFDDYVMESKIDNGILTRTREIDESAVFYGYSSMMSRVDESISDAETDEKLAKLMKDLAETYHIADGKIKLSNLAPKSSDTDEQRRIKEDIAKLMATKDDDFSPNAKEAKKLMDLSTGPSGRPTNIQNWHRSLDNASDAIADGLSDYLVPQELTRKLDLPTNIARGLGAGLGALAFGPLGAIGGTALANFLANSHRKYNAKQYSKLHGTELSPKLHNYTGSMVGAGIGSLLGGPAGGIVGAGLGHLGQKGIEFLKSKLGGEKKAA